MQITLKYGHTVNVDPSAAPADFVAWAIAFAVRQSAGDADAGKANTPEGKKAVLDKAQRLASFEIPTGGAGGARLDPMSRALRDVVEAILRNWGWKAADAKQAAMEPQGGFLAGLVRALAHKAGVPEAAVELADVEEAFGRNWPNIEAKAKAIVAQSAAPSVEL